ncbi:MAG: aminoacetone oxidase family FAD-binding enzyme [Bacteroidales bacterium]|nr:aminoacetone oxidase family FAD-binding enzyme [Bacteroidales bacterium]
MMTQRRVAIVGAGAAGCFAAIETARRLPEADIHVFERMKKPLAKVAMTGGGRCNLTNSFAGVRSLEAVYPRGHRLMKRLLREFGHEDTMAWFEREGVELVTQTDECVFPASQRADEIVQTLLAAMRRSGVKLHCEQGVKEICPAEGGGYRLAFDNRPAEWFDTVVVTTGGSPRKAGLSFLQPLGLELVEPVPSLFSVTVEDEGLRALSGTVVENASVRFTGTKMKAQGALLITHLGLSGPAMLKLSAYAARLLHERDYRAEISINWLGDMNEEEAGMLINELARQNGAKQVGNVWPTVLNRRLWHFLLQSLHLSAEMRWNDFVKPNEQRSSLLEYAAMAKDRTFKNGQLPKTLRRMAAQLTNHVFQISGRNPYKEEFVTCGGVALTELHPATLECKRHPGLYFAGEVADVDAITGGFNLQAAWTMGYVAAKAIGERNLLLSGKYLEHY